MTRSVNVNSYPSGHHCDSSTSLNPMTFGSLRGVSVEGFVVLNSTL